MSARCVLGPKGDEAACPEPRALLDDGEEKLDIGMGATREGDEQGCALGRLASSGRAGRTIPLRLPTNSPAAAAAADDDGITGTNADTEDDVKAASACAGLPLLVRKQCAAALYHCS
jgi:hypothetical protein